MPLHGSILTYLILTGRDGCRHRGETNTGAQWTWSPTSCEKFQTKQLGLTVTAMDRLRDSGDFNKACSLIIRLV